MTEEQKKFIEEVAGYVKKYASQYGIKVHSPIIAQGILESGWGTSDKVHLGQNYFGLKWRNNRMAISNEYFLAPTSEQNKDGSYVGILSEFCKFRNMEECVLGYFQWTNISTYSNLKGVTDPKTYLENIKADGYATSLKYVDNLMAVIENYNLTQYDEKGVNELIIAIDAGHGLTTSGKRCLKSIDPSETKEWWLNNRIADRLEVLLAGYECKIIRVDDTTGAKDISLANRVKAANNGNADVYISIHHNAGVNGGVTGGTEVYYYSSKAERQKQATALYNALMDKTGLRGNRSTPVKNYAFYVIKHTKMPAFLIENGFMDSKTDVPIILTSEHAERTAQAILRFLVEQFGLKQTATVEEEKSPNAIYRVQVGAYSVKANAEAMQKKLKASGFDAVIV